MDEETQTVETISTTDTTTCTDTIMLCHDHQRQRQEPRPRWIASVVGTAATVFALSAGAILIANTADTTTSSGSGSSSKDYSPPTEFVRKLQYTSSSSRRDSDQSQGRTLSLSDNIDIPYQIKHGELETADADGNESGRYSSMTTTDTDNWLQLQHELKIATMPTPSFINDDYGETNDHNGGGGEFVGDAGESESEGEGGVRSASTILPTIVVVTDPVEEFMDTTTTTSSSSNSSSSTTYTTTTSSTTTSTEEDLVTTTTSTTAATSQVQDAPYELYYWIPIQPTIKGILPYCSYTNTYPEAYAHDSMKHITLFESETECCTVYGHTDGLCAQPTTPLEDEGLAEDEAAGAATKYWYPTQANDGSPSCVYNSAYPDDFTHHEGQFAANFLFETQLECCEAWPAACYHFFWYPIEVATEDEGVNVIRECVYGEDYPSVEYYLIFLNQDDCCERWECGVEVSSTESDADADAAEGSSTTTVATIASTMEATENAATLSTVEALSTTTETPVESTTTSASELSSTTTVDATSTESTSTTTTTSTTPEPTTTNTTTTSASTSTTTATTTTTTSPEVIEPCHSHTCAWHESIAAHATCTNSNEYPSAWDDIPESQHHYFFFESAEECCSMRYPDECTVVDVGGDVEVEGTTGSDTEGSSGTEATGSEFITISSYTTDNFDSSLSQLTIPFDLSNQQWEITSTKSHSGVHSITNTHNATSGKAADTAELILKINLPAPTTISCMALIDTSMPFDYFTLVINGHQRNTYHQHHGEEWMRVLTGLDSGENTIVFRVENGGEGVGFLDRDYDHFGSGSVYLDDCEIGATF